MGKDKLQPPSPASARQKGRGDMGKSFIMRGKTVGLIHRLAISGVMDHARAHETVGSIPVRTKDGDRHPTPQILKNGQIELEITRGPRMDMNIKASPSHRMRGRSFSVRMNRPCDCGKWKPGGRS